jgi:hypothetical protein
MDEAREYAVSGARETRDQERKCRKTKIGSEQALAYLKQFGSVTVLNGHIHQTMQKVEGNVTFHTAASTAFPQPQPGKADSPGPMKVPAERLKSNRCELRPRATCIGGGRFDARLSGKQPDSGNQVDQR